MRFKLNQFSAFCPELLGQLGILCIRRAGTLLAVRVVLTGSYHVFRDRQMNACFSYLQPSGSGGCVEVYLRQVCGTSNVPKPIDSFEPVRPSYDNAETGLGSCLMFSVPTFKLDRNEMRFMKLKLFKFKITQNLKETSYSQQIPGVWLSFLKSKNLD